MELPLEDVALRLAAAAAAGVAIGLNRDIRDKPLGMRTLALVGLGSALVPVAAVQFRDVASHPDALARVVQVCIQGLMVGIGFLGAGTILRDGTKRTVHGLTTAACVWVTAAIGLACGLAAWITVGIAMLIALAVLVGIGWVERVVWPEDGE